jgi:hypothetical protein
MRSTERVRPSSGMAVEFFAGLLQLFVSLALCLVSEKLFANVRLRLPGDVELAIRMPRAFVNGVGVDVCKTLGEGYFALDLAWLRCVGTASASAVACKAGCSADA